MRERVAILTTFFEVGTFSLVTVAENQIRMLLDHGYMPRVLVQEGQFATNERGEEEVKPFEEQGVWDRKTIDLRAVVPCMHLSGGFEPDFEERVERILNVLRENLADINVALTHDWVLADTLKEHNVALRRYAKERPDLLWLHWLHSRPRPSAKQEYPANCRHEPPPGYLVYPNDVDRPAVVLSYNLSGQEWRVKANRASHATDPLRLMRYDPLTVDLAKKADFLNADVSCVYPARLDRGKQVEKIIYLMAGVKRAGLEPRLLVLSWQASGSNFQLYINELNTLALSLGLKDKVFFSDRLDDRCSQGVPRHVVTELMQLSTVYVHPSKVETYSLVVHEAAAQGLLLVLNHDWLPMRELFGDKAIYMDFGSDTTARQYHPDERTFWNEQALRMTAELRQNRGLLAKIAAHREWSPEALWKTFEPLLYLEPVAGERIA